MLVAPNRSINTFEQSLATTNESCVAQFSSPTSNTLRKTSQRYRLRGSRLQIQCRLHATMAAPIPKRY